MNALRQFGLLIGGALALVAIVACGSDEEPPAGAVDLLPTGETVLGQPIAYPAVGAAEVSSSIVTLAPGESTGWHHHNTPLYAYILEGAVTVDYGADGTRVYEADTALMEAIDTSHNGRNDGDEPVRILVVSFGAAGLQNTELDD